MASRILTGIFIVLVITAFACTGARNPVPSENGTDIDQPAEQKLPSFEELYGSLYSEDFKESGQAQSVIEAHPDEYIPKLLEMAQKMDPEYSDKAIEMLGRMKVEQGRDLIIQALNSDVRALQIAAIRAVGRNGDARGVEKVLEYSHSEDTGLRGNSANTLGVFPEAEGTLDRLRELATDDDISVRLAAYNGIGKAMDKGSAKILYQALFREAKAGEEDDPMASTALGIAAAALQKVTDSGDCGWLVDGLAKKNPIEVRYSIFETVGKLRCTEAVDPLARITRDNTEDDMTRIRAGFFLASIGDPKGYQAANDIFFALQNGLLKYDPSKFQDLQTLINQYKGFLDQMELASRHE